LAKIEREVIARGIFTFVAPRQGHELIGRVPRYLQVGFTSLDAATARCDFDIGLSGIEDGPARQSRLAVMIPYRQFREVLTVRDVDAATFRTLSDLRRHRVATLAHDLLVDAQSSSKSSQSSMKTTCIRTPT